MDQQPSLVPAPKRLALAITHGFNDEAFVRALGHEFTPHPCGTIPVAVFHGEARAPFEQFVETKVREALGDAQ